MKIAILGPCYPFKSGWAHYNTLLYRALRKKHEVRFIGFKRQYPSFLYPGREDKDYSNTVLKEDTENIIDSLNPLSWLRAARRVNELEPDLVIFHWGTVFWAFLSLVISLLVKGRIVFICHNVVQHETRGIDRILTKLGLFWGNGFIVHSREDRRNLEEIFPGRKVVLGFHPTYGPISKGIEKTRAKKRLSLKGRTVLFFGIVRPYKGLDYLIEAMPAVLRKMDVTLMVAGEFWEGKERTTKMIERLGIGERVLIQDTFLSNEEVNITISAADVVVLPYVSATQSGIVQNAFGLGRPVIVTDVGGLSEAVKDGVTGFVVPAKDPEALAEAIIKFFRDGKGALFEANIRKNKKRFSWDAFARIVENL